MSPEILIPAGISIVIGLLYFLFPRLSRPDLFFSITVPQGFRDREEGARITACFRLMVVVVSLSALVALLLLRPRPGWMIAILTSELVGLAAAFLAARSSAAHFATQPSPHRKVSLEPRPRMLPGGVWTASGPFIILALAGIAAILNWDSLPKQIAVHWGFSGPDRWIERTPESVAGFFLLNATGALVIVLGALGIARAMGRPTPPGAAAAAESRFRSIMIRLLLAIGYLVTVPFWIALFWSDSALAGTVVTVWGVILVATVMLSLILLFRMGQGGSRLYSPASADDGLPLGDGRPDSSWKWGMFYVNPDDPAIFVEKRFGIGYTLNFGNRWTWLALAVLIPVIILSAVLSR